MQHRSGSHLYLSIIYEKLLRCNIFLPSILPKLIGWCWLFSRGIQLIPLFVCDRPPVAPGINDSCDEHFCIGSRPRPRRLKIHKQYSIVFSYNSFCGSIMVLTCESFHVCDALWAVSNYVRFYTGPRSNCRQPTPKQFQ